MNIRSAYISNAHFQGDPMDMLLLLKPPPGRGRGGSQGESRKHG